MLHRIESSLLIAAVSVTLATAVGCSKDRTRRAATSESAAATVAGASIGSANGTVDLGGATYQAAPLVAFGKVTGQISLAAPSDSSATQDASASAAQDTAEVKCVEPARGRRSHRARVARLFSPDVSKESSDDGAAVVWIAGVSKGKPISDEKRVDLASERCALDPRVMAVSVGTTVDVSNDDKALHTLIFTRNSGRDTLTKMPFFNAGQLVASELLAKTPGIVNVICVQHPWTRASIVVFGHPYYAVTDNAGRFTIDSLPPGSYDLMVWTPALAKPKQQRVSITAGGTAIVQVAAKD